MNASDLLRLAAPFAPSDIEWKPGAVTNGRGDRKGLAMAYLTSRAVQDRLDAVCGPADWRNEFRPGPALADGRSGGVLCGLSIRVERSLADGTVVSEWVTKWDGADHTEVEAVKGGLSSAMKRAAVQWGIGRYLYDLPAQWVKLDERGRFAETPRIPREHLPASASAPARAAGPSAAHSTPPPTLVVPAPPRSGSSPAGTRRIVRPAPPASSGDGSAGRVPDRPAGPRR
jgi:hypothetical protein